MLFKKLFMVLVLMLSALTASADLIVQNDQVTIILRDTAGCTNADVAALIVPDELGRFKDAVVKFQGKTLAGCWTEDSGLMLLIDEEGDAGQIPVELFKPYYGV